MHVDEEKGIHGRHVAKAKCGGMISAHPIE
jgi:hypothetical protein